MLQYTIRMISIYIYRFYPGDSYWNPGFYPGHRYSSLAFPAPTVIHQGAFFRQVPLET